MFRTFKKSGELNDLLAKRLVEQVDILRVKYIRYTDVIRKILFPKTNVSDQIVK